MPSTSSNVMNVRRLHESMAPPSSIQVYHGVLQFRAFHCPVFVQPPARVHVQRVPLDKITTPSTSKGRYKYFRFCFCTWMKEIQNQFYQFGRGDLRVYPRLSVSLSLQSHLFMTLWSCSWYRFYRSVLSVIRESFCWDVPWTSCVRADGRRDVSLGNTYN